MRETDSTARSCVLVDEAGNEVTPQMWVDLLWSGEIEKHIFGLRTKERAGEPFPDDFQSLIQRGPGYSSRRHQGSAASNRHTTHKRHHPPRQVESYRRYSDSVASSIRVDEDPSQR